VIRELLKTSDKHIHHTQEFKNNIIKYTVFDNNKYVYRYENNGTANCNDSIIANKLIQVALNHNRKVCSKEHKCK